MKDKLVKGTKFWLIVSVLGSFTTTAALILAERKADRAEKKTVELEQQLQIKTEEVEGLRESIEELDKRVTSVEAQFYE